MYVKMYQIMYFKYKQFIVCQLYINKVIVKILITEIYCISSSHLHLPPSQNN